MSFRLGYKTITLNVEDEGRVSLVGRVQKAMGLTLSIASINSGGAYYNPSTWEGKARGSEVDSRPLLHSTVKTSLCYMRLFFKKIDPNMTG